MSCIPNSKNQYICSNMAICCPYKSLIWNSRFNLITWNMMYPAYGNNSLIDIYFYYIKDYQYFHIMNFTDISVGIGYYIVDIDNKWFLNTSLETGVMKEWNYTVIIVSNKINPDLELNDKLSNYRSVDFTIIQNGTLTQSSTYSNLPTPTDSISNRNTKNDNGYKNSLEIWKIIVIIVGVIIFLLIVFLLIYKKIFKNKTAKEFHNEHITEVIIFQKPDEPTYQKLNV